MAVSSLPIWAVDMVGSVFMILLSFMCLWVAFKLRRLDQNNIIGAYLLWVCFALTVFAVSRSAGHILKQVLVLNSREDIWQMISPFSGAVNTFTFILVGSFTLFFERTSKIYQDILKDKQALQAAHHEVLFFNQNLEEMVAERTKALTDSEQRYRRIFEVSKDMILVTQTDGLIINLNPAGYQMLGVGESGGTFLDKQRYFQDYLFHFSDWVRLKSSIVQGGAVAGEELDLKFGNGHRKRVLLSASLAKESTEKEETIHFLVKDIERQHYLKEQMAQAEKLVSIGELSSGIAHEINNPLNVILGYTQLLLRNEDRATNRYADLKTIEKHVRSCKNIVEDLLSFARKSQTRKEMMDIHPVVDEVIGFVKHHSNLERIKIITAYDRGIPLLLLDGKKIKQVLINLLMNALHAFGGEGTGTIKIVTGIRQERERVYVQIIDDGCGIEKNNISKIFDPFFTTKPTGQGTGLGLSVSYGIVKDHGGDIQVKSEAGKGSTFTILLPSPATVYASLPKNVEAGEQRL
jgi:two-component system NtrC family sensor kinase